MQFIGFEDGTVTLLKYEGSSRPGVRPFQGKLSKVHFNLIWEIQLNSPILGLYFGPLMVVDPLVKTYSPRNNHLYKGAFDKFTNFDDSPTKMKVSSDQLAIVTTKSFHFFSLSLSNAPSTKKMASVDRFVAHLV